MNIYTKRGMGLGAQPDAAKPGAMLYCRHQHPGRDNHNKGLQHVRSKREGSQPEDVNIDSTSALEHRNTDERAEQRGRPARVHRQGAAGF
jgi:hypothetical protein